MLQFLVVDYKVNEQIKLFEVFGDESILHTLCTKLTLSHFRKLIYIKEPLKTEIYTTLVLNEHWNVRELDEARIHLADTHININVEFGDEKGQIPIDSIAEKLKNIDITKK